MGIRSPAVIPLYLGDFSAKSITSAGFPEGGDNGGEIA